jgi:DNA primase
MLVDDIKDQLNIIDLARREGLELKKQSSRLYKAKCIFHDDQKTPNLFFYPKTNTFKCYACGKYGDSIDLYAKLHHISNKQAIKELKTTTNSSNSSRPAYILKAVQQKPEAGPDDHTLILEALREFSSRSGELTEESFKYLTGDKRGLTEETIKQFKIFDIKDYKETKKFLAKKFKESELKEAGLLDSINRFAFTKNKIVIPIIEDSKIVSLRARFFDKGLDDPNQLKIRTYTYPKYLSLKGISGRFFNADRLKQTETAGRLYLCEGEFDTMIAEQNRLAAIGLLGVSNYSKEMIATLKDFDLIICLDNDEPSKKQAYKIADMFREAAGKEANINILPAGTKDLTEYFINRILKH